jgi:hypothetical protein
MLKTSITIRDFLVLIRIRGYGSVDPYLRLTDPDPDPALSGSYYFVSDLQDSDLQVILLITF